MPSSFKIVRCGEVEQKSILPLLLRHDFLQLASAGEKENGSGNGDGEVAQAISEELVRARQKAEEIVTRAQAETERIVREAREQALADARELTRRAEEEGYQKGFAEGYREGLEKAAREGEALRREASQVLQQAKEVWQKTLDGLESEIVSLAREIAEKILATQLTLEPQVVLAIAREALELARNKQQIILYINPEDVSLFQKNREELLRVLSPETTFHILGDAGVERGGCRIETEDGKIEATLRERWQAITGVLQR